MNSGADRGKIRDWLLGERNAGRPFSIERCEAAFPGARTLIRDVIDELENSDSAATLAVEPTPSGPVDPSYFFTDATPRTFGPYALEELLGRGGQGVVFRARDTRLGRDVALKILSADATRSESALARFRREAAALSRLEAPGLCTVYETGIQEGLPFIAMQWIRGVALSAEIRREAVALRGPSEDSKDEPWRTRVIALDSEEIRRRLRILAELAETLHLAHESGLVHRDIKPSNILIADAGPPVILDFGLALVANDESPTLTLSGDQLGTPAYMAPEQVRGKSGQAGRTTDVYGLGVTLYEWLTVRRPFESPTREGLYRQILTLPPIPPSRLQSGISRDLDVVILTAMDKDPARRYQTAQAFADDLRRVLDFKPIAARPLGPIPRLVRWAKRNPATAAALSVLLLFLSVGLVVVTGLWRRSQDALGLARQESRRADMKSREATRNLEEYLSLSDAAMARGAVEESESLFPPRPETVPAMQDWLERAKDLVNRRERHRDALRRLRERRRRRPLESLDPLERPAIVRRLAELRERRAAIDERRRDERSNPGRREELARLRADVETRIAALEREVAALDIREYLDVRDRWRASVLEAMLQDLDRLAGGTGRPGLIADVERRIRTARAIRRESLADPSVAEAWRRCIAAIASDSRYGGLELAPQFGLVPLGRDPDSGLFEFAHILTGAVPRRGGDGRLVVNEGTCLVLVLVPGGRATLGAAPPVAGSDPTGPHVDALARTGEGPVHGIHLDPFFISKYEMSIAQWERGAGDVLRDSESPREDYERAGMQPLRQLSWANAALFLPRMDLEIPTEAQWEYAARAGATTPWPWGREETEAPRWANFGDGTAEAAGTLYPRHTMHPDLEDGFADFAPVDGMKPNAWGLHHVLGNVWEICRDPFGSYEIPCYPGDGLRVSGSEDLRSLRGGSFRSSLRECRFSMRASIDRDSASSAVGVRPSRRIER